MSVSIRIPMPLRGLTNHQDMVNVEGSSVSECIDCLEGLHPGLKERLCDESGELRRFINLYINGEDVRFLSGLQSAVKAGDEVSIVPAVAGG